MEMVLLRRSFLASLIRVSGILLVARHLSYAAAEESAIIGADKSRKISFFSDEKGSVHLDARVIPLPSSISAEARAAMIEAYRTPGSSNPLHTDKASWRLEIENFNASMKAVAEKGIKSGEEKVDLSKLHAGDATYYLAVPKNKKGDRSPIIISLHGGGLVRLGGAFSAALAVEDAIRYDCPVYSVDYRMPPDHPYPTPLDDVVAVYKKVLHASGNRRIVMMGSSAGGNLAAAATLKIRDLGMPMPAAVVLLSPEADLTESGDSFQTNLYLDSVLKGSLMEANLLYANGEDLKNPYISPLFADFNKGFPPTFIQSGTRDLFLSNAVRMHRALRGAGLDAQLHVWEAMPHAGFSHGAPEDQEIRREVEMFMKIHGLS